MDIEKTKLNNKVRLLTIIKNDLEEESRAIYDDLKQTRNELEVRTEEIQEEFFNILGNAILLMSNGKNDKALAYLKNEYEILKKDLFDDNHEEQTNLCKTR